MKWIPDRFLYLFKIHDFVFYEIGIHDAPKKEKAIRAYIEGADYLNQAPELQNQLASQQPLEKILALLQEFDDLLDQAMSQRYEEECAILKKYGIDPEGYEQPDCYFPLYRSENGKNAYLPLPSAQAIEARLVLKNANLAEDFDPEDLLWYELTCTEAGLKLDFWTDDFQAVSVSFDGFEAAHTYYSAMNTFHFPADPWSLLAGMAGAVRVKPKDNLNQQEQQLLPLLEALENLHFPGRITNQAHTVFLERLQHHGLIKAEQAFLKLQNAKTAAAEQFALSKLLQTLQKAECEPLWREIYEALAASQADIPARTSTLDQTHLQQQRAEITETLEALGYSGAYPDFFKEAPIKGIRLATSYGMDYTVGFEKRARHMIRAMETVIDGRLFIHFISGTVLLRKENACPDVFTAMFNDKGKRFFSVTNTFMTELTPKDAAVIAAKRAELKKLTKQERSLVLSASAGEIWFAALMMGLFFGVAFTVLFGAFIALFLLIDGALHLLSPWHFLIIFLMATLGFGVCMGFVMLRAQRK